MSAEADFANGFHLTQHIGPNYLGGQLDSDARTAIHLTHRIGALLVTLVLLGLAWQLKVVGMTRLAIGVPEAACPEDIVGGRPWVAIEITCDNDWNVGRKLFGTRYDQLATLHTRLLAFLTIFKMGV